MEKFFFFLSFVFMKLTKNDLFLEKAICVKGKLVIPVTTFILNKKFKFLKQTNKMQEITPCIPLPKSVCDSA